MMGKQTAVLEMEIPTPELPLRVLALTVTVACQKLTVVVDAAAGVAAEGGTVGDCQRRDVVVDAAAGVGRGRVAADGAVGDHQRADVVVDAAPAVAGPSGG